MEKRYRLRRALFAMSCGAITGLLIRTSFQEHPFAAYVNAMHAIAVFWIWCIAHPGDVARNTFVAMMALLVLPAIVIVHELGHFTAAKICGMQVDVFAIGFGKSLYSRQKNQTVYSLNAVPLGGYVKIAGMKPIGNSGSEEQDIPNSFTGMSYVRRMFVICAGVLMNIVFAWVLFTLATLIRVLDTGHRSEQGVVVQDVTPGLPAQKAGILPGDTIRSVNQIDVSSASQLTRRFELLHGSNACLVIERHNQKMVKTISPEYSPDDHAKVYGISYERDSNDIQWYQSPLIALGMTWKAVSLVTVETSKALFSKEVLSSGSSPIGIVRMAYEVNQLGWEPGFLFTGFVSLAIAFMNILPLSFLDGGKAFSMTVEKIRGKQNNEYIEMIWNYVGLCILLVLVVAGFVNDFRH